MDRIHPESYRTLEQLVKIHGSARLITAIREIDARFYPAFSTRTANLKTASEQEHDEPATP